MRRRRKQNSENYDSLLDTMANVVGILIIILVVTQINVGDAVNRIQMTDNEEADPTKKSINELKDEIRDIEQKISEQKDILIEFPEPAITDIKLQQVESEIEIRKTQIAQFLNPNLDFSKFTGRVARLRASLAEKESELRERQKLLGVVTAKLGAAPVVNVDQKTVRLPNPRSAPPGSRPVIFFCRRGRIAHFDINHMNDLLQAGILNALQASPRRKFVDNLSHQLLVEHFSRNYIGDENFRLSVMRTGTQIFVEIDWRDPLAGESIQELGKPNSAFNTILKKIKAGNNFISFNVWSDAFETYLAARQIADENEVAAGWIAFDENEEYRSLLFQSGSTRAEYLID